MSAIDRRFNLMLASSNDGTEGARESLSAMAFLRKEETAAAAEAVQAVPAEAVVEVGEASTPCWKKKAAVSATDGGFLANVKDHIDEFVNTPMDQHRICLKRTMADFRDYIRQKKEEAFGSSKVDGSGDSGSKEVASSTAA